jgi:putative multiple sugar transport system substrate-binding protein
MRLPSSLRYATATLAAATFALALGACSSSRDSDSGSAADSSAPAADTATSQAAAGGSALVGITMPTVSLERWNNDGSQLKKALEDLGYSTMLDYAQNKNELQISQLENQINEGAKVLVIASIDGSALGPTLEKAKAENITVIAYDRLIMQTEDVDYYATFDNYKVGQLQGQYIVDALDLDNAAGPFNLEPFAGSPDDNNAKLVFQGAWDVLKPYVDSGKLVIQSETGKSAADNWMNIGILEWSQATAQSEMENRLNTFYSDKKVDAVLSPNDSLAMGIAQALETRGYQVGVDWPILTGQDADKANVQNIIDGKQSMTVWKDTRDLAAQVSVMVDQVMKGTTVDTNSQDYNNGVKTVPSYLLTPMVVTKDKVQTALIDSGFISASDVTLS